MFKSLPLFVVLSLIMAVPSLRAADEHADGHAQHNGPCAADMQKFCKDVKPGGGRIMDCMAAHHDELSAACKAKNEQMKSEMKDFMQACKDDVTKYCSGVKPGEGRIWKCLKENESKLTEACKKEQAEMKEKHREHAKEHKGKAMKGSEKSAE